MTAVHDKVPLAEAEADLAATRLDMERLEVIVFNLNRFITDAGGEDRSKYKLHLFTFSFLLDQARALEKKIIKFIAENYPGEAAVDVEAVVSYPCPRCGQQLPRYGEGIHICPNVPIL